MPTVPFSSDEFFGVFAAYNAAVWPVQPVLLAAAVVGVALVIRQTETASRATAAFLALLWIWTGVAYHLIHFRSINPAAVAFGVLFVLQGVLFVWWGLVRRRLSFRPTWDVRGLLAAAILVYAVAIYPLLGWLTGHPYMASPTFGAPCPIVIYTFGLLLLAWPVPAGLLIIPVLWAVVGSSAVVAFGVLQDAGLLASALVVLGYWVLAGRRPPPVVART